jgi:transposase-like protein
MPKTCLPYAPAFRRQMIVLVRAGRDPEDLSREFEPTAQSIRNWVSQADRNEGRREEKVEPTSSAERDELIKLRREVRQL